MKVGLSLLSATIGGGSMLVFAVFLFAGPPGLIELEVGLTGKLAVDALFSFLFFLQHSGMVRRSFKVRMTRLVPDYSVNAIFSIASGLMLLLVVIGWQESSLVIVSATGAFWWTLRAVFVLALAGLVWGAIALQGIDALGLAQLRGRPDDHEHRSNELVIRGPYRWVRHPLYLFVILMIWSYPHLTLDRVLFNVVWTAWIVIGAWLEERDLVAEFGDDYSAYQQRVPMLIPYRIARHSGAA